MAREALYKRFLDQYGGPVHSNQILAPYTTYRTGGAADLFINAVDVPEIVNAIKSAQELSIPYFIIGGGSNLLVGDKGFRGLIIRNHVKRLEVKGNEIITGAGEDLDQVVDFATERSLQGLEFAAGIWGTIGGAIYGNAGAFGSDIGTIINWAELIDAQGHSRKVLADYFEFTYRKSILKQTGEIVVLAGLGLTPGDKAEIVKRTEDIRNLRCQKHPIESYSAGCFFKNVEDPQQPYGKLAAGKLLDDVGAKKIRVGGAAVSDKHANIIINADQATSKEIRQLADILKDKVRNKFGIELQEEVVCVGEF